MYKKFNANPLGKRTGDCVIRAFAFATGKTWEETLTGLYEVAIRIKSEPAFIDVYTQYAEDLGLPKTTLQAVKGQKRPTVDSFCKEHRTGTYILRVANHVVAVKDGNHYDTWDSGDRCVYVYWKVN